MAPTVGWKRRYGSIDADEVVRRFTVDGTPGVQIAKALGVRRSAIYRILKAAGVDNQRGWRHHPAGETRRCSKCEQELPLGAFGTYTRTDDKRGGIRSKRTEHRIWCRRCWTAYYKPSNQRAWLERFGLTAEQYADMVTAQGGACAICGRAKRLVIDHSHALNVVRKLLCHRCNSWMAAIDDKDWLAKAMAYASAIPREL